MNVSTSFQRNGMFNQGWPPDFSPGLQWYPPGYCLGGALPIPEKKGWSSHHSYENITGGRKSGFQNQFLS